MAKKEAEPKTVLERSYNVPLRRRWMHVPKYKRAKKAVTTLKVFLIKHMKPGKDEKGRLLLNIGKYLNEELWKYGMKNPPHHIKIITKKDEKGLVTAELEGAPVEEKKEKKKKEVKKEEKKEEVKEDKAKQEEKKELEAIKKEVPKAPVKSPAIPKQVEKKVTGPANK
ncbi:hypothetical protein GOV06_03410 [Candidatus Woesearchaeota archaeon]|nr:hypothetical protein [Candidatus Woesearchaeota archaeon]